MDKQQAVTIIKNLIDSVPLTRQQYEQYILALKIIINQENNKEEE